MAAGELLLGIDSRLELGICDGSNLQFIDEIDVHHYWKVRKADLEHTGGFVMIRGHWHPEKSPGKVWPSAESEDMGGDWDRGLQDMAEDDQGPATQWPQLPGHRDSASTIRAPLPCP